MQIGNNGKHAQRLEQLMRVSREISMTAELTKLYRKITTLSKDLIDLDFSTLMLLSQDKSRLVIEDTVGFSEAEIGSFSLVEGGGLSTYVVERKLPCIVSDFRSETRFDAPDIVRGKGIVSAICVPMMIEEEVFGVLIGYVSAEREFNEEDVSLYRSIADQAASAIKNSFHVRALKENEEYLKTVLDAVQTGILVIDAETHRIVTVNPVALRMVGAAKEFVLGRVCHGFVCPAQLNECPITDLCGEVNNAECILLTPGCGEIPILKTVSVAMLNGRKHLVESFVDISERKAVEDCLAAEKERLAVTLRSIGDAVITTDTLGEIILLNKVAEELTGWKQEDARGKPLEKVFYIINEKTGETWPNPVKTVLRTGTAVTPDNHTVLISKDARERIISAGAAPIFDKAGRIIGVVLVFRDVTAQRRTELELLKTQKLDSVGVLAGGIAHDFNNLLTAILGNIDIAKLHTTPGEKVHGRLSEAEKATLRARDLTQQLLTFARGGAPVRKTISVGELIRESASFTLRGSDVCAEFFISDDLRDVDIDEGQISQVIQNLVINADQAMPSGGIITIRAENVTIPGDEDHPLKDGDYVKISITDRGAGISQEHMGKIFDPYFTTKQKGSGLGLATSYFIIKNHDGHIAVSSREGEGATFYLYLPATARKGRVPGRNEEDPIRRGKGRVLIMDDEEAVLEIASDMLEHIGYETGFARNGEEAVRDYVKAWEAGAPFDAVIMDLTIPGGMGGKEAVKRILAVDPDAKVIVSSGYSNDPVMANYLSYGFKGVVVKPYKTRDLSLAVHTVMTGRGS